jgi:hypothetical protein
MEKTNNVVAYKDACSECTVHVTLSHHLFILNWNRYVPLSKIGAKNGYTSNSTFFFLHLALNKLFWPLLQILPIDLIKPFLATSGYHVCLQTRGQFFKRIFEPKEKFVPG